MSGTRRGPFDNLAGSGEAGNWYSVSGLVGPTDDTTSGYVHQPHMDDAASLAQITAFLERADHAPFFSPSEVNTFLGMATGEDKIWQVATRETSAYGHDTRARPHEPYIQQNSDVLCNHHEFHNSSNHDDWIKGILQGPHIPSTFPQRPNPESIFIQGSSSKQAPSKGPIDYSQSSWLVPTAVGVPPVAVFATSGVEAATQEFFDEPSPFPRTNMKPQSIALNATGAYGSNSAGIIQAAAAPNQNLDNPEQSPYTNTPNNSSDRVIAGTSANPGRPGGVMRNPPSKTRNISPYLQADPKQINPARGNNKKSPNEAKKHTCPISGCGYSAARSDGLTRHLKSSFHNNVKDYSCKYCGKRDARSDNLKFHEQHCKQNPDVSSRK